MDLSTRMLTVLVAAVASLALAVGGFVAHREVTSAAADQTLAQTALRPPGGSEQFYFVMTDRFANGDPSNDRGGLTGGREVTGFDPTDKGFYHGGDLAGLTGKLDYIRGLGTTAIWLTPTFANRPVQGTGADLSAGYHGYWITDFTRIDPHLGTNEELKSLIEAAHGRGMKVYFDIITNHTADVIHYADGNPGYITKAERPYQDAVGQPFDDVTYVGTTNFPATDPQRTAPKVPVIDQADRTLKVPAWLNDPMIYHNRGDTTWAGESETYGDFIGLDDLWTERPEVVAGMIDIYQGWIDLGIDGFRIDTVKHVNLGFWQQFGPAIQDYATSRGKPDFFSFAEVYTAAPSGRTIYSTAGKLPATLDFGFQEKARDYAMGQPASGLADLLGHDDAFTDADSNATFQPTFLGNHDMGRIGMFLAPVADSDELLARAKFAHAVMFLTRGQPVVYYGDEQGFIGAAGDKDARQDLFATQVAEYADQPVIGAEPGSRDRYDPNHPLYRAIAALAGLRLQHPALATGASIPRLAQENLLVTSRIDRTSGVEYLVAFNNATQPASATVASSSPGQEFTQIFGGSQRLRAGADGSITVEVPALGAAVLRAASPMPPSTGQLTVAIPSGATLDRQPTITAGWTGRQPVQVTFAIKSAGTANWTILGADDSPDYAVTADLAALPSGPAELKVVARDYTGRISSISVPVTLP